MEASKLIFVLMSLVAFVAVPVVIGNARRYFLALASFLYVFTSGWIFYNYTGLMLADIPILCLFFMALFSGRRLRFWVAPMGQSMLGIVFIGLVSAVSANQPGWSVAEVSKFLRMYLLLISIVHHVRSIEDLRFSVTWMLVGLLIESLVGIYQWKVGPVGIWFLGERPAARHDWRSMGTFYVPSFYANYLAMVLCVALRMFVFYEPRTLRTKLFFGFTLIAGIIAFYTTYARGPWLSFLVAIAIMGLLSVFRSRFRIKSQWALPVLLIFAVLFGIKYHTRITDQFGAQRRVAYESRFPQFGVAKRMIKDYPLTGVGLGNYKLHSWDYLTPEERNHYLAPVYAWMVHNSYLLFTAETGYLGGFIFICWYIITVVAALRILKNRVNHPFIVNVTMGIFAGVIAMIIFLMTSPDIHEYSLIYQMTLFCALLTAEQNILKEAERKFKMHAQQRIRKIASSNNPE